MANPRRPLLILHTDNFREHAIGLDRRKLIRLANTVGPSMHLLHWQTLADLGRLPRFDEGHSEDALTGIDRFGAPIVEVFMVSHRWLRASLDPQLSHPDNENHNKAWCDKCKMFSAVTRRRVILGQHGELNYE